MTLGDAFHGNLIGTNVHRPYSWNFADAAARAAYSTGTTADLGKWARQLDDDSIWMLDDIAPVWVLVGGPGGTIVAEDVSYDNATSGSTAINVQDALDEVEALVSAATYTDEQVRDVMGVALVAGNNIDIVVNDAGDTITIDVEALTSADLTDFAEAVDDRVGALFVAGNNIDLTYNDGANTFTIDVEALTSADLTDFSEAVDDRVGALIIDSTSLDVTYNDAGNALSVDVILEWLQDTVAAMFTGGTHTGLTTTYQDAGGVVDLALVRTITQTINVIIDGGGVAIPAGNKHDIYFDFACTIIGWTALADVSGSVSYDVWKDTYTNYPPTAADKISASAPVAISATTKAQDTTLTGWTTSVSAGDTIRFNQPLIATTITRVTIALKISRSI